MTEIALREMARSINLRELGGIPAAGGRAVRRGVLYRSAALAELTEVEHATLCGLGLHAIVDLRYNSERSKHPTPWEGLGSGTYWALDYEPSRGGDLSGLLADNSLTSEGAHQLMVGAYRELVFSHVEAFQHLFRTLVECEGTILFHCTSGKDRTGIAAALILTALGASREAIYADYLASLNFDALASPAFRNSPTARREVLRPLYTVHRDYLASMFEAIEARDGSVEDFLQSTLLLRPEDLSALRQRLLA